MTIVIFFVGAIILTLMTSLLGWALHLKKIETTDY
jgi:hypothetical protein